MKKMLAVLLLLMAMLIVIACNAKTAEPAKSQDAPVKTAEAQKTSAPIATQKVDFGVEKIKIPSAFEDGCMTVCYVDNAHSSGLPGGLGGVLETFRLSGGAGYGYQKITQITGNQVWLRRITSSSTFGPWMPQSPIVRTYAPSSAPAYAGGIYVDTANQKAYLAMGTSATSDWKQITLM